MNKAPIIALAGLGLLVCPCSIRAIQFGQIDDFQDGTTQNWENGGAGPPVLNLDGGPAGPGDLFMQISSTGGAGSGSRLTVLNRAQWLGDYIGQGVTAIEIDLKNFGSTQLSIRIAFKQEVGRSAPGYVSQPFVIPGGSGWQHVSFSITPGTMTAINSPVAFNTFFSGNFEEARIINAINPDLNGDPIVAQLGIDNIEAAAAPLSISGVVIYCTGTPRPVPEVTLTLSGDATGSTMTDNAGIYTLFPIPSGGNYTVTPTPLRDLQPVVDPKPDIGDALRVQAHFQSGGTLLNGCAELAAHTTGNALVDTGDALAIAQFFVNGTLGSNNLTGKWRFVPSSRSYPNLTSNPPPEDTAYDCYILGDVTGGVVFPTFAQPAPPR